MNQSNKMKKLISLSVFLVFFGINQTDLYAQNSAQNNITASALVLGSIEVNTGKDLDFGQILQGETSTVTFANAGTVNIVGTEDASVDAEIDFPDVLTHTDGSTLAVNNRQVFFNSTASLLDVSTGDTNFPLTLGSGTDVLHFIGSVNPTSGPTGEYTATINVTVTYN